MSRSIFVRARGLGPALAAAALVVVVTAGIPPAVATVRAMQVNTDALAAATSSRTGLHATKTAVSAFRMIGLSWAGPESAPVRVRVHDRRGWHAWMTLDTDASHGPDLGSHEAHIHSSVSEPAWVGAADGYEVTAPAEAGAVKVHLVRATGPKLHVSTGTPRAAADTVAPAIHLRAEWQARAPKVNPTIAPSLKMAFVHHTVTSNDYAQADVPALLRGIQAYHMDTNGWDDIGYNFLVDRFGTIWEGRQGGITKAVVGAQTEGFNTGSTGVAVLGDFSQTAAPLAAVQAVGALLGWKLPHHGVDPYATATMTSAGNPKYASGTVVNFAAVSGHRDGYPTECPGLLYNDLGRVRQDAEAAAGIVTPYPGFPGGVFIGAGHLDASTKADVITGADAGGGPHVRTFNPDGSQRASVFPYPSGFLGGVRVAAGNVDALGTSEIVTGAGPGGGPHVEALHEDGTVVESFYAYDSGFHGGVYVASGNVDGLPGDEIITGAGPGGGPNVRVFTVGGVMIGNFFAYDPGFRGGVRVGTADIDGDGKPEIITAPGPGGGPNIRIFHPDGTLLASFFAYDPGFTSGVYVAGVRSPLAGDWIATAPDAGGGPNVRLFTASGALQGSFFTGDPTNTSGIRIAGNLFTGTAPGNLALGFGPRGPQIVRLTRLDGSLLLP